MHRAARDTGTRLPPEHRRSSLALLCRSGGHDQHRAARGLERARCRQLRRRPARRLVHVGVRCVEASRCRLAGSPGSRCRSSDAGRVDRAVRHDLHLHDPLLVGLAHDELQPVDLHRRADLRAPAPRGSRSGPRATRTPRRPAAACPARARDRRSTPTRPPRRARRPCAGWAPRGPSRRGCRRRSPRGCPRASPGPPCRRTRRSRWPCAGAWSACPAGSSPPAGSRSRTSPACAGCRRACSSPSRPSRTTAKRSFA